MDIDQIIETLQIQAPTALSTVVTPPKEKTLEQLLATPFKFLDTKDKIGLPMEHADYVRQRCNDCYGLGYVIQLRGGRHYETCHCVNRGYMRTRKAVEREADARVKRYDLKREDALKQAVETSGLL